MRINKYRVVWPSLYARPPCSKYKGCMHSRHTCSLFVSCMAAVQQIKNYMHGHITAASSTCIELMSGAKSCVYHVLT